MSSIRFVSLVAVALVAFTTVACAPATYGEGESEGDKTGSFGLAKKSTSAPTTGSEGTTNAGTGGAGTCAAACVHYLSCKGASTPENQQQCTTSCNSLGKSSADLASYEQTDCATAITLVEGNGQAGAGGQPSGASSQGSECDGCVADGSYCIWTSKSDWGKGPYSGAVIECDAKCCQ